MDLTDALWPRWRAWTLDLDRGLTQDRLHLLAARSGLEAKRLEAATLRSVLAAIAPTAEPQQAVWPWVLTQGSRNRRRHAGLPFCPACLVEDSTPYFRRAWRLAWHVGCVRHGGLLADHCGRCRAPAEPHRSRAGDSTLCSCPSCGHDLRLTRTAPACVDALAFQDTADQVLANGHGTWSSSIVGRSHWFSLATQHSCGRILVRAGDSAPIGLTSLALNLQRPSERVLRLRMAHRGMRGEPRGEPLLPRRHAASPSDEMGVAVASPTDGRRQPMRARPRVKVQGEWVRLLRRHRIGHP